MTQAPSELSKKSLETFVMRLASQLASVAMGIIVARHLGPEGKGEFSLALATLALLVTVSGGASAAISRQYGRLKWPSGVVHSAMLQFFGWIVVPLAAAVMVFGIATHQVSIVAAGAAFAFAYLTQVTVAFSLTDGEVRWANVQWLILNVIALVAVGALALLHAGLIPMLVAWTGAYAVMAIVSLQKVRAYASGRGDRAERLRAFKDQLLFGVRVTFNQLIATLNYEIDIYIVMLLLGSRQLGLYSVAVGIGQMMWQLSRPLAVASYGGVTSGSARDAARLTVVCIRHAILTVGAASAVLFFVGPYLIELVYGSRFAPSGRALQLLLPGIVAYCTAPFFSQYFTLQAGKPTIMTVVTAASTLVCAVLTYTLIPHFGILAGAIGTSASYMTALAICAAVFCRMTNTPPYRLVLIERDDLRHYYALLGWVGRRIGRLFGIVHGARTKA